MITKICSKCMQLKTLSEFTKDRGNIDGKNYHCKECIREKYAKDTGRTKEQVRDSVRSKFSGKIIDGNKMCSQCQQMKPIDCFAKTSVVACGLRSWCKICNIFDDKVRTKIIKMEFVIAYGGKCVCCGETELELLTVEHIRFKGHKLIYDNTTNLLYKLKALGWPKGYTILCWNCNLSTKNGRPCVHTEEYKLHEQKFESRILTNQKKEKYNRLKRKLYLMNLKSFDSDLVRA